MHAMERQRVLRDWYWRMPLEAALTDLWLAQGDLAQARLQAERFLQERFGGSQILGVDLKGDLADPATLLEVKRFAQFARAGLTQPVVLPFVPAAAPDPRAALLRTLRAFP